ncbi:MAG TPA: glycosyltransferase family 39 protein [Polyangiaceae bacterium]|nr:glycosyltransferase family 39 protein [Polyangiaceae bacterium]
MTVPFLLCVLFPLALVAHAWLTRHHAVGETWVSRLVEWPSRTFVSWGLVACVACVVAATTFAVLHQEVPGALDDAFISYRYAKNLAFGHSLTWNPGEAPSEGYTNLLLVLLVTPVIRFGGDPLLATRVLSGIAALGMVALIFHLVRREHTVSRATAALIALGVFPASTTPELVMLGLETMLFASTLLLAYVLSERFFEQDESKWMLRAGGVSFLALLLRPEAIFLPIAIVVGVTVTEWPNRERLRRVVTLLTLSFAVPLVLYLLWKLWYFGSIVPNPALVKMPGHGLTRPRGVTSVSNFVMSHGKLILLASLGFPFLNARTRGPLVASLVVAAYLLFYLRVDTLMDMNQRFLYPAFPFLLVLTFPALATFTERFLAWRQLAGIRFGLGLLVYMLVFYGNPGEALRRAAHWRQRETDDMQTVSALLTHIGIELGKYPKVADVTLGNTDAGLIPYFSGARQLDMAGLVTRFIATHKDVNVSADYFFSQHPDLVIVRTEASGKLINYEHGVLGDYTRWAHHPAWNDYVEEGAANAGPRFALHFFIRQHGPHAADLEEIVRLRLAQEGVPKVDTVMGTAR